VDSENEYIVEAEVPGIRKEDIDLNIEEENLVISVNRTEEVNKEEKNYIHRERRASSMSRRIRLQGAKLDEITAKLDEGILVINIPKNIATNSPRKIEIK